MFEWRDVNADGTGPGGEGAGHIAQGPCLMDMPRQEVTCDHVRRDACFYVRQSTLQKVFSKHGKHSSPV